MSSKTTDNGYDTYLNEDTKDERQEIDSLYYLIGVGYVGGDFLYQNIATDVSFLDFADTEFLNLDFVYEQAAILVGSKIAHDSFISTDSKEEYIGAKIGSTVGGLIGGNWGAPGAASCWLLSRRHRRR